MSFTLDAIIEDVTPRPPKLVIYGPHGVGKTTFGAGFYSPILLMTEDGVGSLRIPRFPEVARSYHDVMTALGALYQGGGHGRQTLVLDSLDWLEPLVWAETARRHNKDSIEAWDYGKGYVFADEVWSEFFGGLDALNGNGMSIVCTAHAAVTRFQSPTSEPYDRYSIKLHKRASALVQEWADVVGFAHWQTNTVSTDLGFKKKATRGVTTGQRLLALQETPAWEAKNRYQLPAVMELDAAQFLGLLADRYTPAPVNADADTPTET